MRRSASLLAALPAAAPAFGQTITTVGDSLPDGVPTVSVTFTPTATGIRSGQLTVTSGATTSPNNISLSGRGL
jgi:hypothetical protein